MMEFIQAANSVFWGWLLSGLLLFGGIFLTTKLGFPQIRFFPNLFTNLRDSMKAEGGAVSGFGVLCAALGSLIGTGTLVGTATAIASGGPGAIFWMWVVALISMPIGFSEAILGQLFREKGEDGTYHGGTAYYLSKGLNQKKLAAVYSVCMIISIGFFYAMLQSNSISNAIVGASGANPLMVGIVVLILTALVILGGLKRLANVTSYLVPVMALGYILCSLYIVSINYSKIPAVFELIFKSAFTGQAATGGAIGYTVQQAFRYGVARGMFSSDAGTGIAAGMHSGANVKHPVQQGFSAMFGTFIVTIVICSSTAFCILFTGVTDTNLTGINLTQAAFVSGMGEVGKWVVAISMFLFAYTSLLSDVYLGEANIRYLFKKHTIKVIWVFRAMCSGIIIWGAVAPVNLVWDLVDFTVAFLVFINLIALFGLSKKVKFVLNDYIVQKKNGVKFPVWDYNLNPEDIGKK